MEELIKALGHINFYLADADEIFAGRKENVFDSERIRISLEVEMLKDIRTYTEDHKKKRYKIHDKVYRQIYETTGDSELAECVSEDYCLIYDGQVVGYKDKWFAKFRNCYAASVIPSGQL